MNELELTDTHCHLYLNEFSGDLPDYMKRAEEAGVREIYMPALDKSHFLSMEEVEKQFPTRCFSMIGVHPCYVKDNYDEELQFVRKKLTERKFAAVGEIGLDFYWDRTFTDQQVSCFREQVKIAREYELPIVIHSRNSMDECIQILKDEKNSGIRGIFHCFSGNAENAVDIINCGLFLGIGGVVTYKNAGLAEVITNVPLEHIVLETDAPYLSPVPFRGKRNESSYLKYIAEKIAQVKGVTIKEVARITTANARKIFTHNSMYDIEPTGEIPD